MEYTQLNVNEEQMEFIEYEELFPCGCWHNNISMYIERTLPLHWHDSLEVLFLKKGRLDYCVDGKHYELMPGDGLFINSNAMHTATQIGEKQTETFELTFRPELIGNGKESLIYKKYVKAVTESGVSSFSLGESKEPGQEILKLLQAVSDLEKSDFFYEFDCLAYVLGICRALMRIIPLGQSTWETGGRLQKHEDDMWQIISYIYEHYREKIVVGDLTRTANISKSECFGSFLAYTMKTPLEFINDYRLLRAAGLLKDTEHSITGIGQECGFDSSSYFTLQFKRKYGLTPGKYRLLVKHNGGGKVSRKNT